MLDGRAAGGRVFKLRDYLFARLSGLGEPFGYSAAEVFKLITDL